MTPRKNENVSAVFYPIGVCDMVIQKLYLDKCNNCMFIGTLRHSLRLQFVIPYPTKHYKKDKYAIFNAFQTNLTELVIENNYKYIPLPDEDNTQDIVIR